jgi:transcriptional regulator with XRE-family HTH domain
MPNRSDNKIKQIRERLGLSQKEFAEKIGVSKGYLSAIESNTRKPGRKIFEGIIKECLEDLVIVYSGKPDPETVDLHGVAEPGPLWNRTSPSIELSPREEALIRAVRFLGPTDAKDLYYKVMSRLRKGIQQEEMEEETIERLKEVIRVLGQAAIE